MVKIISMLYNISSTQVDELISNMSTEEQVATLSTLNRIFDNVIQYPNDDKYHQIKLTGKTFDNKVWQYPSGKRLMKTSGWVVENDHVKLKDSLSVPIALTVILLKLQVSIISVYIIFIRLCGKYIITIVLLVIYKTKILILNRSRNLSLLHKVRKQSVHSELQ